MAGGWKLKPYSEWTPEQRAKQEAWCAQWKANNPERAKLGEVRRHLRSYHGMTLEAFNEMLERQQNLCAICSCQLQDGRKRHVDHNHVTKVIRGILCRKCNLGLHYAEDKEWLTAALRYLS